MNLSIKCKIIKHNKTFLKAGLLALLAQANSAFTESTIPSVVSFSIGSISASLAENPDTLTSTDGTATTTEEPYTGKASSMPLDIMYEFFPNLKRSYFLRGSGPLLASTPDRYFSGLAGVNFYFGHVGTNAVVKDFNFEMKLIPRLRYYVGPTIGVGYLVYNTKSATKNDTMLEVGGQAGVVYTIKPKWGLRAEIGGARATGVLISSTIIKILIGTTYNLGN
jgi:hypothetical protein